MPRKKSTTPKRKAAKKKFVNRLPPRALNFFRYIANPETRQDVKEFFKRKWKQQ